MYNCIKRSSEQFQPLCIQDAIYVLLYHNLQDGFVVRILNPVSAQSGGPLISSNELPLKLARKCLTSWGTPAWQEGVGVSPVLHNAEDVVFLGAGKEFSLMLTSAGQVS